jgi:hypothetical protein
MHTSKKIGKKFLKKKITSHPFIFSIPKGNFLILFVEHVLVFRGHKCPWGANVKFPALLYYSAFLA